MSTSAKRGGPSTNHLFNHVRTMLLHVEERCGNKLKPADTLLPRTPLTNRCEKLIVMCALGTNENDNDKDHSFSQLSVHKALTCPEGQSSWSVAPSLYGEKNLAPCRHNSSRYSCSDLLPVEIKWSCICAGVQNECAMRNPGCFVGRVCLMWMLWCCGGSTVD